MKNKSSIRKIIKLQKQCRMYQTIIKKLKTKIDDLESAVDIAWQAKDYWECLYKTEKAKEKALTNTLHVLIKAFNEDEFLNYFDDDKELPF